MPDVYEFQATGDETEIFRSADETCTPLILIPFPNHQSIEDHQALVHKVVNLLNAVALAEAAATSPIEYLTPTPTVFILMRDDGPWIGDWTPRDEDAPVYATADEATARNDFHRNRYSVMEVTEEDREDGVRGFRVKAKH